MRRGGLAGALVAGAIMWSLLFAGSAVAEINSACNLWAVAGAAPGGNGQSPDAAFASVRDLVNGLAPGQTGCLSGNFTENVFVDRAAPADQPITVTSFDSNNRASITGVAGSSQPATVRFDNPAAHVRFQGIDIRGVRGARASPAVVITGTGNALIGNDISNTGVATCVNVGLNANERARDSWLEGNYVHDCGPRTNGQNGIAIGYASGTRVYDNTIFGVPARGVELYPEAHGSHIAHNVIDGSGNGQGDGMGIQFAGEASNPSSNNLVERNIISNNEAYQIGYYWGGPPGSGNLVRGNCVFSTNGGAGEYQRSGGQPVGYELGPDNVSGDPRFVNRSAPPAGLAVQPGSPCAPDRGPLPSVITDAPQLLVSPESGSVLTANVPGRVNTHFQPARYRVNLLNGAHGRGLVVDVADLTSSVPVSPGLARFEGLQPSTEYSYRAEGLHAGGARAGETRTFTTPRAPTITPPIPTLTYKDNKEKRGLRLRDFRVRASREFASLVVSCAGRGCPFRSRTIPVAGGQRTIRLRGLLQFGVRLQFRFGLAGAEQITAPSYAGRVTTLRVVKSKGKGALKRTDQCILGTAGTSTSPTGGPLRTCLRVPFDGKPQGGVSLLTSLKALAVPAGASVALLCKGRGCPKLPRCRLTPKRKTLSLLPRSAKSRRFPSGTKLRVEITKPDTRGLVSTIKFTRKGPQQTYGFLPAGRQRPLCATR